jgi:hypothetical protein
MDLEKLQEQFRNTINSAVSGKMSPGSIKETIKQNLSNLTNNKTPIDLNISQNSPNIEPSITPSISEKQPSSMSYWFIFKIILAIIIIGLLVLNVYSYIIHGVDGFTFLFSDVIEKENESENAPENIKKENSTNDIKDNSMNTKKNKVANNIEIEAVKMARNQNKMSSDIENTMEKKNKNSKHYKANNLATNVNKKAGYCYVGSDRNVRTCVEVGEDDHCMSGEVFPTRDICINPNLKD